MAPKNNQQKKDNKAQKGGKGKARSAVISPPPIHKVIVPVLPFPMSASQPGSTSLRPVKKWCFASKVHVLTSNSSTPAGQLQQGSIVTVLRQNIRVPGSESSWAEILYEGQPGWVNEVFLDEYIEESLPDEVKIPHPTETPHDAAQYMILDDMVMHNMCGELCVAYLVKNDIDPEADIETVLKKWEEFPQKGSFSYTKKTIIHGTTSLHLRDMLEAYGYTNEGDIQDLHTQLTELKPLDPENLNNMLRTHYLIARVKCRVGSSGELVSIDQGSGRDERNHWIVVERITHNGTRVEVYNPFHNKRETYSYNEFFYACTAPKLSGLWVIRKSNKPHKSLSVQFKPRIPKFEVPLDTPKPPDFKAEQYMMIEGQKKTQLCGEFSVAYILGKSIDRAVLHWKTAQEARIRDLLTVLKAYGYYEKGEAGDRSFSMEAVLNHWKEVQPKLYEHHVGKNQPTGTRELTSILNAYGYKSGDYIGFRLGLIDKPTGQYLPSPGRIKKMLETHFLIAGVGIDGLTGRLIRGPKGVRHWVVVEKISPVGRHYLLRHYGGNGGWVTLYNPFTNVLEEYSYREFTDSMSETGLWDGLWVKRNIKPEFLATQVLFPNIEVKGGKQGGKPAKASDRKKWSHKKMMEEIQKRLRNGRSVEKIPALLFGAGSGWSREEISRLLPAPRKRDAQPPDSFEALVREHLEVESLPAEITILLQEESRGDLNMAFTLADTLCEMGILIIGPDKRAKTKNFPVSQHLRRAAVERFIAGLSTSQQVTHKVGTRSVLKVANVIRPVLATQIITKLENIRAKDAIKNRQ